MPGIRVNDGGTWKTAQPRVRDGGTWKTPSQVWAKDGGTWKLVWPETPVAPTVSIGGQDFWSAAGSFGGTTTLSAIVVGGTGPFTYSWEAIDSGTASFVSPTAQTTVVNTANRVNPASVQVTVGYSGGSVTSDPFLIQGTP